MVILSYWSPNGPDTLLGTVDREIHRSSLSLEGLHLGGEMSTCDWGTDAKELHTLLLEQEAGVGWGQRRGETSTGGVCRQLGWEVGRQQDQTEGGSHKDLTLDPPIVGRSQELTVGAPPAGESTGLMPSAGIGAHPVWLRKESADFLHPSVGWTWTQPGLT